MNAFVHHPLVIVLTALEAFSYMMTCEINNISWRIWCTSGALFDPLEAMVSELLPNWTIFAKKITFSFYSIYLLIVLTPKYSFCRTCNSHAHYSHKLSPSNFYLMWAIQLNLKDSYMHMDVLSYLMYMVRSVTKDLGNLCLPFSAFDAGKLADCAATSFMLMACVPKIQYCTIALYKH
ncbi:hypothetical protein CFP56_027192 [Quercus suber]|uniref:Uncharacterized protein n=1 Tax=Quercus suber TaxID=58331 RepID=A0AAW0JY28_QUESU